MLQAGASEADSIAASWLAKLSSALQAEDTRAFAATFLPNGWFRDVLTFVWDTRSIRGPDAIASYLSESNRLAKAKVTNITLDKDPYFVPHFVHGPGGSRAVEVGFRYETEHTTGRAYAHLEGDDKGLWNALTLAMIIVDIKGHEEPQDITTNWDAGGRTWMELEEDRRAQIESNPYVLIGESRILSQLRPLFNYYSWWWTVRAVRRCTVPPNGHSCSSHRQNRAHRRHMEEQILQFSITHA